MQEKALKQVIVFHSNSILKMIIFLLTTLHIISSQKTGQQRDKLKNLKNWAQKNGLEFYALTAYLLVVPENRLELLRP